MRVRAIGAVCAVMVLLGATPSRAQVKKQDVINSVKAAFSTWEKVDCSSMKFTFPDPLKTFEPYKDGGILVFFGYDQSTWIHGKNAYFVTNKHEFTADGNLSRGIIALNARDYGWSIGAEKNRIDIETAVLHLIPDVTGFYVGNDPGGQSSKYIKFEHEDRALEPLHEVGASYSYFEAGAGCQRPPMPRVCGTLAAPPASPDAGTSDGSVADAGAVDTGAGAADAGVPTQLCIMHSSPNDLKKGKPLHWVKQPIKVYIFVHDTYGDLPGGKPAPTVDGGTPRVDAGSGDPTDGSVAGKTCVNSQDCGEGFVCSVDRVCVALAPPSDSGCSCRTGTNAGSGPVVGLFLLAALWWVRRRRRA